MLKTHLSPLVAAHTAVQQTTYVERFSQQATCHLLDVASHLSEAAVHFAKVTDAPRSIISDKTQVVASHPLLGKQFMQSSVMLRCHTKSKPLRDIFGCTIGPSSGSEERNYALSP